MTESKESKKKKKVTEEDQFVKDVFNRDMLLNIKKDLCIMCKGDHEYGVKLKKKIEAQNEEEECDEGTKAYDPHSLSDVDGVWASKYSLLNKTRRIFIHLHCALPSPQASFDGKDWYNLAKEVNRCRSLSCKSCGEKGATLGCLEPRCNVVMHIPCAVRLGYKITRYKRCYICPDHLEARLRLEIEGDKPFENDLSKGYETFPVNLSHENELPTDVCGSTPGFEYTTRNVDSDQVVTNSTSVLEMDYCKCEGLCNDVVQCACLSLGRNYTYTGTLIPGMKHKILECNMRCSCSIRSCTNRVVEKGLTVRLEVFKVASTSNSDNHVNENSPFFTEQYSWGVRTLDFIPENAFVCEVTGQFLLGSSVPYHANKEGVFQGGVAVADLLLGKYNPNNNSGNSSSKHKRQLNEISYDDVYGNINIVPVNMWETYIEGGQDYINNNFTSSSSSNSNNNCSSDTEVSATAQWVAEQLYENGTLVDPTDVILSGNDTSSNGIINNTSVSSLASIAANSHHSTTSNVSLSSSVVTNSFVLPIGSITSSEPIIVTIDDDDEDDEQTARAPSNSNDIMNRNGSNNHTIRSGNSNSSGSIASTTAGNHQLAKKKMVDVNMMLKNHYDEMNQFLRGQLCIDSRYFGNVGSFIRRRSHTRRNNGLPRMLHRKLVYTNKTDNVGSPKFALFAAMNIEPNTELFI